jgi:CheY-like chemotaxis protein
LGGSREDKVAKHSIIMDKIVKNSVELPPLLILLIDDDQASQQFLCMWLEKKQHKVTVTDNGESGLQLLRDGNFDLLLTDLRMPNMDGIMLVQKIRQLEDSILAAIPIIGVTADVYPERIKACLDAGMNSVISKPVDMPKLTWMIKNIIKGGAVTPLLRSAEVAEDSDKSGILLDRDVIEKIYSSLGVEVLAVVVGKLDLTAKRSFKEMGEALKNEDQKGVADAAHLIKGAALHLGLFSLYSMAHKIEILATTGELATIKLLIQPFKVIYNKSEQALAVLKDELKKR